MSDERLSRPSETASGLPPSLEGSVLVSSVFDLSSTEVSTNIGEPVLRASAIASLGLASSLNTPSGFARCIVA